jgi:hypothetical protein
MKRKGKSFEEKTFTDYWYEIRSHFEGILFYEEKGPFHVHQPPSDSFVWYDTGRGVDKDLCVRVWTVPLEELPLYLNTEYAPIAKKRLENAGI